MSLLGDVSYLLRSGAPAGVAGMDEVRVAVIRTGVLDRLVADDPEFGRDLFRSIGEVLAERLDRRTSGVVAGMAWSWG